MFAFLCYLIVGTAGMLLLAALVSEPIYWLLDIFALRHADAKWRMAYRAELMAWYDTLSCCVLYDDDSADVKI